MHHKITEDDWDWQEDNACGIPVFIAFPISYLWAYFPEEYHG
jgi:hypothetical protein